MAQEPTDIQTPTVATVDGWEVTSSSLRQPSVEEMTAVMTDVEVPDALTTDPYAGSADASTAPAQESDDQPASAKPKKSASERTAELRARINAETRAYHDARRAREAETAELMRVRQEREQLTSAPATKAGKPVWSIMEENGTSYDEFVDARDEWVRQQVRADFEHSQEQQRQHAQAERRHQDIARASDAHDQRINDAVLRHPDFLEVVEKNLSQIPDSPFLIEVVQGHAQGAELLYHLAQNPDEARVLTTLEPSAPMRDALKYLEMPVEVLSYFAQHPQEFDRLNHLHPATALVALGEIHAQLKGAKNGSPAAAVSNAKPPTRPVVGGRTSATKNTGDMAFGAEWIRAENARESEMKKISGRRL